MKNKQTEEKSFLHDNKMTKIGILGVPFDYGTELIGGRVGSRLAPKLIKDYFFKNFDVKKITDYSNIIPIEKNVVKTHERITIAVNRILNQESVAIVIGGSHDISYASVRALTNIYNKVGGINCDAHFDVRPVVDGKITSGTPFRRLLDDKLVLGKNFVEFGMHAKSNLEEHHDYLMKNKSTIIKLSYINRVGIGNSINKALNIASRNTKALFFDIDIDGIKEIYAPGCSAPSKTEGFTRQQMLEAAYLAGKHKKVKLFNLMEVNPKYDIKNKTVKLSAELIDSFVKGVMER